MPQMSELSPGLASGKWGTAVTDIRGYLGSEGGRTPLPCHGGSQRPKASPIPSVPSSLGALASLILSPAAPGGGGGGAGRDRCCSRPSRSHWTLSGYYNRASKHSITLVGTHIWAAGVTSQAWGEGGILSSVTCKCKNMILPSLHLPHWPWEVSVIHCSFTGQIVNEHLCCARQGVEEL